MSCRAAARQLSASMDERLDWRGNLALRLHLVLCRRCRRHRRHLVLVQSTLRLIAACGSLPEPIDEPVILASIQARLRRRLHEETE